MPRAKFIKALNPSSPLYMSYHFHQYWADCGDVRMAYELPGTSAPWRQWNESCPQALGAMNILLLLYDEYTSSYVLC